MKEDQPSSLWWIAYPLYEHGLAQELEGKPRPKHVAIMVDGNRRWAREAGFTDVGRGHRVDSRKITEFVGQYAGQEIELVIIYLLSTEDLGRDSERLELLFDTIANVVDELTQSPNDVCLRMIGHLGLLPKRMTTRLRHDEETTANNADIQINIAVDYDGRQGVVDVVCKIVRKSVTEETDASKLEKHITIDAISRCLYISGQPDLDLAIHTSGGQRLSGPLLWQTAYSEIQFIDTCWPEFHRIDLLRTLRGFSQCSRCFDKQPPCIRKYFRMLEFAHPDPRNLVVPRPRGSQ